MFEFLFFIIICFWGLLSQYRSENKKRNRIQNVRVRTNEKSIYEIMSCAKNRAGRYPEKFKDGSTDEHKILEICRRG